MKHDSDSLCFTRYGLPKMLVYKCSLGVAEEAHYKLTVNVYQMQFISFATFLYADVKLFVIYFIKWNATETQ